MTRAAIISFLLFAVSSCEFCQAAAPRASLIAAIIQVESGGNDSAFNKAENAAGCLQIRPIMVREVNRIAGTAYTLADRLDRKKSIEMFTIYTNHYTPCWAPELVARRWNGGPRGDKKQSTAKYWHKVRSLL